MLRSALVSVILIAGAFALEHTLHDPDGAIAFLRQYGYLDAGSDRTLITDDDLRHAISLFQEYYHLPVDGALNNATLRWMSEPRCGVSDASSRQLGKSVLRWPHRNLTWNFRLVDKQTIRTAEAAFALWAANSSLTFTRDTRNPHIVIAYRDRRHTMADPRYGNSVCPADLDGPGTVLAHATFPTGAPDDVSEVHVDVREAWHIALSPNPAGTQLLLRTLVHEIGHSLGLSHSSNENAIMYPVNSRDEWPVRLDVEDILNVQNLYGAAEVARSTPRRPPPTLATRPPMTAPTTTTTTTTTTRAPPPPDPCSWRDVDALLVLDRRLFVARGRYAYSIGLDGAIAEKPFLLRDYMRFLPRNLTRLSAAYQTSKGDLVLFADDMVYMASYPELKLRASWPRRATDLGFPPSAVIRAALSTHAGRTYVVYDDYAVLELDECDMMARGYKTLQTVFPGIPSTIRTAYRYIDGQLYFLHRDRFFAYNEFTATVTRSGEFDLDVIGVTCPREGILRKLWALLDRLARSGVAFE